MVSAYLFWVAFSTIFVAELVGDKLFYGIGALTVSFSPASVACGMVPAFMGKMLAAVLLGGLLSRIPALDTAADHALRGRWHLRGDRRRHRAARAVR